jgi:hypothetical protein
MTRPANEPGTGAVLRALTRILERAAALHAGGCDPRLAINRAITAERASFALARVARAAWALALLPGRPVGHARRGRARAADRERGMGGVMSGEDEHASFRALTAHPLHRLHCDVLATTAEHGDE